MPHRQGLLVDVANTASYRVDSSETSFKRVCDDIWGPNNWIGPSCEPSRGHCEGPHLVCCAAKCRCSIAKGVQSSRDDVGFLARSCFLGMRSASRSRRDGRSMAVLAGNGESDCPWLCMGGAPGLASHICAVRSPPDTFCASKPTAPHGLPHGGRARASTAQSAVFSAPVLHALLTYSSRDPGQSRGGISLLRPCVEHMRSPSVGAGGFGIVRLLLHLPFVCMRDRR